MKFLKYALIAAGALAVAASLVVAYLVLTFDVRDYEPRLVALVKEKTGRTLTVRGQTRLSFWPDLGVTLGPVALSERDSDAVFAEVGNARLVAKLRPLLAKSLVADELHLEGANVRITRDANGRLNIDDLLSGEGGALDFDIARARIERSRLVYEDVRMGVRHEAADLEVTTGRLTSGVPTPLRVSFRTFDAAKTHAVSASAQGRLTFDLTQRTYVLDDATVRVEGKAAGVSELAATIKGGVKWSEGVLRASAVSLAARGVTSEHEIQGHVELGTLIFSNGAVSAESVSADAQATAAHDTLHASVTTPRVDWRVGMISAGDVTCALDLTRDARKVHATIVTALSAGDSGRAIELTAMRTKFVATGPGLPKRGIEGALAGALNVDTRTERIEANLAGTVLESRVKAKLAAAGSASPSYTFTVDVDALDLDRLGVASAGTKGALDRIGIASASTKGGGFDLADLSGVRAAGMLRIGSLKSSGVVAKNVQLAFKP